MPARKDFQDSICSALSNPVGAWFRCFIQPNISPERFLRFNALQLICLNLCLAALATFVKFHDNIWWDEVTYFDCLPLVTTLIVDALLVTQLFKFSELSIQLLAVPIAWNVYVAVFALKKIIVVFLLVCSMELLSTKWVVRMVSVAELLWIYFNLIVQLVYFYRFRITQAF